MTRGISRLDSPPAGTHLAQDLAEFAAEQDDFTRRHVWAEDERPDYIDHYGTISRLPGADVNWLYYAALQERHVGIVLVDDAESPSGEPLPNQLSVYTMPLSRDRVERFAAGVAAGQGPVLHGYLRAVTGRKLSFFSPTSSDINLAGEAARAVGFHISIDFLWRGALSSYLIDRLVRQQTIRTPEEEERYWRTVARHAVRTQQRDKEYERLRSHIEPLALADLAKYAGQVVDQSSLEVDED